MLPLANRSMLGVLAFRPPYRGRSLYVQSSAIMISTFGLTAADALAAIKIITTRPCRVRVTMLLSFIDVIAFAVAAHIGQAPIEPQTGGSQSSC